MSGPLHKIFVERDARPSVAQIQSLQVISPAVRAEIGIVRHTAETVFLGKNVEILIQEDKDSIAIYIYENPPARPHCGERDAAIINAVEKSTHVIMTKVSELPAALAAVADRVSKAKGEILAEIENLKAQIGTDQELSPEAQASLNRLTGLAGDLDDINPDAPAPTPTPEPTPEPTPAPAEPAPADSTPAPAAPSDGVPPV